MSRRTTSKQIQSGFYARDTSVVARDLLGCILESRVGDRRTAGKIVEVEAYVGPHDPAAHGYGGKKTQRNASMFGPPGTAYVYFIYGMHWCFNVVTERIDYPAAVLIRALEPKSGLGLMCDRRGVRDARLLCSGPARLCQALGITGAVNGSSLRSGLVRISRSDSAGDIEVATGPRIGISRARDWALRFVEKDSDWLSQRTS